LKWENCIVAAKACFYIIWCASLIVMVIWRSLWGFYFCLINW